MTEQDKKKNTRIIKLKEFVERVQKAYDGRISLVNAKKLTDAVFLVLHDALVEDREFHHRKIGRFKTITLKEQERFNPKTREKFMRQKVRKVRFKPSPHLVEDINVNKVFDD